LSLPSTEFFRKTGFVQLYEQGLPAAGKLPAHPATECARTPNGMGMKQRSRA